MERICAEGGVHDLDAARLAIAQAGGDVERAVSLLRVWAATLPPVPVLPLTTRSLRVTRRVSAAVEDVPGGQWLGASPDFESRMLAWPDQAIDPDDDTDGNGSSPHDRAGASGDGVGRPNGDAPEGGATGEPAWRAGPPDRSEVPRISALLADVGQVPVRRAEVAEDGPDPFEAPLVLPASRGARLAALARGETGALVSLASTAMTDRRETIVAELTTMTASVAVPHPRTGRPAVIAEVTLTEAEVIHDAEVANRPGLAIGYGVSLGRLERRAIAIAILDGAIETGGLEEGSVLGAVDGLATSGFVDHLRLPHYASFASYLARVEASDDEEFES